ncbi:MAG: MFS transporter [Candidatus Dormiibacterota bacterium]
MSVAAGISRYRSVLRHRDLRLLLTSELISGSGSWAYNVGLAVYVYERTHSAFWVSAIFVARFIPSMLVSPYGGIVAERLERVRLLTGSNLIMMGWQLLLTLTVALHLPVALAIGWATLTSLTSTAYTPGVAAMVPQLAGEDDLAAANALNSTIDNLLVVVGPALGAGLLLLGSPTLVFAANAATFGVAAVLVRSIRARSRPSDVTEAGASGPFVQMWRGLQALASSPSALALVSFSVLASFVYGTDTVLFVYISKLQLGTGATGYGYLLAGLGVGGILAALMVNDLAGRPRLGPVITVAMAVYCVPTAALIWVHSPIAAFVLEVIRGGGTLVVDVLAVTALQRSVAPSMVARVFGVFFALVMAAIAIGALVTATLLNTIQLHPTLAVLGLGIPALAVAAYPYLHRIDSRALVQLEAIKSKVELLSGLGILAAGSRASLERLARACSEETAGAGEAIVREGETADAFYVLRDGRVDVSALGEGATARHLRTLGPGSFFGEIGLLEQIPRTATVTALEPCRLYRIAGDEFLAALTSGSAAQGFLEGSRARLSISHPTYRARYGEAAAAS